MILQLNPPLPLHTPKGTGLAHLVIDYGPEFHLIWCVALDKGGECWSFENHLIAFDANETMGRTK